MARPWTPMRQIVLALGLGAVLLTQMLAGTTAIAFPDQGKAVDACAAERAPILERQRQIEAIKRSRLGKAIGAGLAKGAMFFGTQMMNRYMPGLSGLPGIPGLGGGTTTTATPTPAGFAGLLSAGNLSEASQLAIPGVTAPAGGGAFAGAGIGNNDTKSIAAMAVIVAVIGTVDAYVQLKEQEAGGDNIRLANSIDEDASHQVAVGQAIAAEEKALSDCRARQVADYKARLSSASNDQDRHNVARDKSALDSAIKKDVDLTGGVVDQQAGLAKTYTQGRAMSEGKSEAQILGGQAPAYAATASTTPLKLPPPPAGSTATPAPPQPAPPPPPPPQPVWTANKAATMRSSPSAKGAAVASLAAGTKVDVQSDVSAPEGWTAIKAAGQMGYVRTASLSKSTPGGPAAPTGPVIAPPTNIREHNQAVIAARDQGPNRLKTLLTDVDA